ncbi:MAG: hypothetical protein WC333_02155 [Dehalococcoidia bacterium]|jgi:hypothetical protein
METQTLNKTNTEAIDTRVNYNFGKVFKHLMKNGIPGKGMIKKTNLATLMGFTTTTQLDNTLAGVALLSTKAIVNLVKNLNINPAYLFTGKGEMFFPLPQPEVEIVKTKFKIWVEIERIDITKDGDELYENEDNPLSIAYRDDINEAVALQDQICHTFGEIL